MTHLYGFLLQLAIVLTILAGAYALVAKSLREMLDEILKLPSATTFYMRSLLLLFVCVGISSTADSSIEISDDTPLMQYVWQIDSVFSEVFGFLVGIFVAYLIIITILTSVLRRRNVQ